jgi:hypothetical protein
VDQGAAVGVGTAQAEVEVGREQKKRTKRENLSVGHSPYSRTRRWKRWAVNTVGGEAATVVSWARARQRRPLSEGVGAVQTRSARGSYRAADGWAQAVSLLSLNYPNWLN